MIVVLRTHGISVIIFRDDHEPAHVHVHGNGQGTILLRGIDGRPELVWSRGMSRADQRKVLAAVREAQHELLEHWRQIHG